MHYYHVEIVRLCRRLCDPRAARSDPLLAAVLTTRAPSKRRRANPTMTSLHRPRHSSKSYLYRQSFVTRPHRTILDFTNHLNFHQPSQSSLSITMARGSDVLLVIVAIIFPPAAAAFITGCSCDLLINLLLTILVSRAGAGVWSSVNPNRDCTKWACPERYRIGRECAAWRRWV